MSITAIDQGIKSMIRNGCAFNAHPLLHSEGIKRGYPRCMKRVGVFLQQLRENVQSTCRITISPFSFFTAPAPG